ncbi:MAG: diaminopimelate epimerase [Desulfovibrio sp.]|nr:diaminopimelate epimerase [Desulfovibrio sp.]
MPKLLPFTKMHGAGNDYVYVSAFEQEVENPGELARRISDRHFGVGSDGLVLILPSSVADVRMRMFNADGSEAEMCGNASRCVAKYAYDHGLVSSEHISLETGAGIKHIDLRLQGGEVVGATVDMGCPELEPGKIPVLPVEAGQKDFINRELTVNGTRRRITAVSMGNPHAVLFLPEIDSLDLAKIGPHFETHAQFPKKTNTEFVQVLSPSAVKMRVWERGAGETLACGTGACATAVACVLNHLTDRTVDVRLLGGTLRIEWRKDDGHVLMSGNAVTVFDGVYRY